MSDDMALMGGPGKSTQVFSSFSRPILLSLTELQKQPFRILSMPTLNGLGSRVMTTKIIKLLMGRRTGYGFEALVSGRGLLIDLFF